MTDARDLKRLGEALRRGDPAVYAQIVDHFGPGILHYLFTCVGHRETAEDLLQDTMLAVVRHGRRLKHPERLRAWLFRIARHTALNWQRRRRRHPDMAASSLEEELPQGHVTINRARDRTQRHDLRRILEQALASLPSAEREVLTLRHFEQLSSAEVAQVLRVRIGTVHSRTHRGLKKLRRHLQAQGHSLENLL
ncbi:sigma-70 family RNA polymerase sigma factor [Candidatus Sumerlaeota bacterium]|nr:sigma-70 family RNA polymerase sigma factor [Candidatus Sumerlaeota bacterium]